MPDQRRRPLPGASCRGFTLIEILLVVTIIGLLATIAIPQILGAKEKTWRAACEANLYALSGEMTLGLDQREGSPTGAEDAIDVTVARVTANGAGPSGGGLFNPRVRSEDAYVDKDDCGVFVPTADTTCQVFFCYSGQAQILSQQWIWPEGAGFRTYRIVSE